MGMRTPETCWSVNKRQVISWRNCCIWLVDLFELYCWSYWKSEADRPIKSCLTWSIVNILNCQHIIKFKCVYFNPLNAELNPICYLLALLAHHFLYVSRIRVNVYEYWKGRSSYTIMTTNISLKIWGGGKLRTGSFKLFKRPLPAFLKILTRVLGRATAGPHYDILSELQPYFVGQQ